VPQVQPEQTVTVALNSASAVVGPRTDPVAQVQADLGLIPPGPAWLRLRVDGVDSRLVGTTGPVPVFRSDRQVNVP
jgi:hypothetical protein